MIREYFTKRNVIIVIVLIFLSILLFVAYDNLHFRLKSTSPSLSSVATSSVEIKYHFSQPIKSIETATFNGSNVSNDITIEGKIVTIPLVDSLNSDSTYEIVLKSITSEWFDNKIDSIERKFTPTYIDFNQLSDDEQQAQIEASNSGQVNDDFINKNTFPIFNERWQIDASVITSSRTVTLEVQFFEEIPDYDNGGVVKQVPNSLADQYRQEVLNEIKKRGGNPDDYEIIYQTNKYLYEKYNHTEQYHD